ncbi:MAG: sugar porter family MFS transporter [Cytophagales bacterium]|nr:sugar porter family MFS transporter [Bernardetiaceae bacterium]MDW8210516.1 sugar porter family MFS transporter [Cytophagales bacterium]
MKKNYLLFITFIAAFGGFLFGFDTAVIAGAIPFAKDYFQLDELGQGWAVGCAIIGCAVGAATAGALSDTWGRKPILILTGFFFTISAIVTAVATSFDLFIIFRIVGGLGIGAASVLCPTYISEISPPHLRGRLVSLNQLMIVIGILMVYISNYLLVDTGQNNWRWMLGVETAPALLFLIALLLVPESPRWLVKRHREEEAAQIMSKIMDSTLIESAIAEIRFSLLAAKEEKVQWRELFQGRTGYVIAIGTALACFQQITGINAIIYYAPTIFMKAGAGVNSAFWQSVIIGLTNLLFTFVAIGLIDRLGRKALMLWGSAGMALSLLVLVAAFALDKLQGYWVLLAILGYIASFAASLAPVMWVVVAEMYPNRIRGAAMSFSIFLHWSSTFLVVQTFPWLLQHVGGAISFGIFALLSAITFVFVLRFIPETKGKSLEEIQTELGLYAN